MPISYEKRLYGLDVLRAYAIFVVVMSHGRLIALDMFESLPFIPWVDGVELFFTLSGFLIGSILIKTIEKENGLRFSSLFSFWKKRWFRTLPNYYFILLINVLFLKFQIFGGDINAFNYSFLLFLHNFSNGLLYFFWESWSLSIEEWFYILFPLGLFFFLVFFNKKQAMLLIILTLILAPLFYRISISTMQIDSFHFWDIHFRKTVITRLDAIMYGVLAAYIKFYYPNFWKDSKNWLLVIGVIICLFGAYMPRNFNSFYSKTFLFCVASLGTMFFLPKADSIVSFKNNFIGKIVTYVSLISYSLYLVNFIVVQFINTYLPFHNRVEQVCCYLLYWILTFVLSSLLYHFFEKPMMNLRDTKKDVT